MTTTTNLKLNSLMLRLLFLLTLSLTSCSESNSGSDEEVTGSGVQTVELSALELSSESGTGIIYYLADIGTLWEAEIVDGGDFVSFTSREELLVKNGVVTSQSKSVLYFYYTENSEGADRYATINFTFEDSESVALTFWQLSTDSEDSPYNRYGVPRWSEIPTMIESDNYMYVTHSSTLADGTAARNFSLCFDIESRAAAWVAYPYHKVYDGDVDRTEAWTYDPKIPTTYQANLSGSYGSYNGSSYDRGHQMASADRLTTTAMNRQTFYYSNMTPQLATLNQQSWATLESQVRSQVCSDTLFVVTGADFSSIIGYSEDKSGNACAIPGAYYKVLLRTRTGYTGKSVSECSASELQAIGFWVEHQYYSSVPSPVTVKEIEEKTGFTFFPDIPDEVKASYTSTDWSF